MVQLQKQIIIIDHEPFSTRRINHYFINQFIEENFQVSYWDVQKVFTFSKHSEYFDSIDNHNVTIFNDLSILKNAIKKFNSKNTVFIIELPFNWETLPLYKNLNAVKAQFVKIDYYSNPISVFDADIPLKYRIRNFSFNNIFTKIANKFILNKFYYKYNNPNLSFISGDLKSNTTNKYISIDYFDVIDAERIKDCPKIVDEKYIVFLDIMLVSHPDLSYWTTNKNLIDPTYYYSKLNSFFEELEQITGYKVVIASHPKANYTTQFGSRQCIAGKTAELVKDCEFVITHGSLSVSFAAIFSKPLLYFYLGKSFEKSLVYTYILYRIFKAVEVLGIDAVDIETDYDLNKLNLLVDDQKYSLFLKDYYQKNTLDERSNYNIIKDSILMLIDKK